MREPLGGRVRGGRSVHEDDGRGGETFWWASLDLDVGSGPDHGRMTTATGLAIEVAGLSKSYGELTVLDGFDLVVAEGTV